MSRWKPQLFATFATKIAHSGIDVTIERHGIGRLKVFTMQQEKIWFIKYFKVIGKPTFFLL